MRTEVHVHGFLELVEGVARPQVESALRPLLDYLDADRLADIGSMEPDQPGFVFHDQNWSLEMCCTLEAEKSFYAIFEASMHALGPLVEKAAPVEVSSYHEDGPDELQLIFVGPTPAAILEAQRQEMMTDMEHLLARHFGPAETGEVLRVVDNLFRQQRAGMQAAMPIMQLSSEERRRLH